MKMEKIAREELKGILKEGMGLKSKVEADKLLKAIDSAIEVIVDTLEAGEKVSIGKYISLEKVTKEAHIGRNPSTGEDVEVPAKDVIKSKLTGLGKALVSKKDEQ